MPVRKRQDGDDYSAFVRLDQAGKDAAYNNTAAVSDSIQRLADWEQRSAECRTRPGVRSDLCYGDKPNNRFDYFPSNAPGGPLFIFIHGGYWQRNSKEIFGFVSEGPCACGINVATIGYTLAPQAHLADIVDEVFRAIDHIEGMAEELGFDANRIHVGGWSAGAHLAALAARSSVVRGVLAISGIFDLAPIRQTYLNEQLQLRPFEIETLAPIRNLPPSHVPVRLFFGGEELSELQRQSRAYEQRAQEARLPVTATMLAGHNHYTIMEQLAAPDGQLTRALEKLVAATV